MVATRGGARQAASRSRASVLKSPRSEDEGSPASTWNGGSASDSSSSVSSDSPLRGAEGSASRDSGSSSSSSSSSSSVIMTRKRRLVQEVQAHLSMSITPYWEISAEGDEDETGDEEREEGTPRRSRRGEARRKYEDAMGEVRQQPKMDVNLPPMVSTREGGLLAVEVFGDGVLEHLPAEDRGARVGHCSSGYVCGHPVPRGKEGNRWCQTPVRASLESKMACMHHSHRRRGGAVPTQEQLRYMMLADEFYDQQTGEICWQRVVSYLRARRLPLELGQRKQVLTAGGRAVAVTDTKIVLHGFVQCLFFWLAACRLTRRGYQFTMVAHASKSEFKELLAGLRATALWPPPSPASSPFVCVQDKRTKKSDYASGYEQVCRMF